MGEDEVLESIKTRNRFFSDDEWRRRYNLVLEALREAELDAVIVTSTENIFYLTGFHTTGYYFFQAVVFSLENEPFILTREMERVGAQSRTWLNNCRYYYDTQEPIERLSFEILSLKGIRKIGYDKSSSLFPVVHQEKLFSLLPEFEFEDVGKLVEQCRRTKSLEEINVMKEAAIATEAGMLAGIQEIRVGVNENDLAAAVYNAAFRSGGEYPACPSFIVSGSRGYIGHATWEGRTIREGDLVFFEIGGCKYRYHTAMMRTAYVGKELPPLMKEAEKVICQTLEECMPAMKPGVMMSEIDRMSKQILNDNSFGYMNHVRFGYSIGVAFAPGWGEDTVLSLQGNTDEPFEENMTFHLIPFMMIPGVGTVGISETVRITPEGAVSFFNFPRKIFLIDPSRLSGVIDDDARSI